jgi:hypothetical protein
MENNGGGNFNPYEGSIQVEKPYGGPAEEHSNELAKQFDVARRSLNYDGRFAPSQPGPGSTNEDRNHKDGSGL